MNQQLPRLFSSSKLLSQEPSISEQHLDILGAYLFLQRDNTLDFLAEASTNHDLRAKLGSVKSAWYRELAEAPAPERESALRMAKLALNLFIESLAGHLGAGTVLPVDFQDPYHIRYVIHSELVTYTGRNLREKVVQDVQLSHSDTGMERAYGKWLNAAAHRGDA